jgi:hypothetical protein
MHFADTGCVRDNSSFSARSFLSADVVLPSAPDRIAVGPPVLEAISSSTALSSIGLPLSPMWKSIDHKLTGKARGRCNKRLCTDDCMGA